MGDEARDIKVLRCSLCGAHSNGCKHVEDAGRQLDEAKLSSTSRDGVVSGQETMEVQLTRLPSLADVGKGKVRL